MTLPTGTIRMSQMNTEYGGGYYLSNYYYNGSYLKANNCTENVRYYGDESAGYTPHLKNIPSSGTIYMSVYRGKTRYYVPNTYYINGYDTYFGTSNVEAQTDTTAYIDIITNGNNTSTSTSSTGLTIASSSRSYTTCYFLNQNAVFGKGGDGGRGGDNGSNGGNGGLALRTYPNMYIANYGNILGGGGGGGGGGSKRISYREGYCSTSDTNYSISGSGGGGGIGGGSGGSDGDNPQCNFCDSGGNGSSGDYNYAGQGGSGCGYNNVIGTVCSYEGGDGGFWGSSGESGQSGYGGGSGGQAIVYNASKLYRLTVTGTIYGGIAGA